MTSHALSRRGFVVGAGVLVMAACSAEPTRADPAEPLPLIAERFAALEKRYGAFIGVAATDVDTRRSVAHRADDPFALCSTFKVYAAARVLQKAQLGEIALTDAVTIEAVDIVANSPLTGPRVGQTMTVAELCEAALQRSDNTAGNWLLRVIGGPSAVTDFARTIGDDRTRLDRWETELNSAIPGDPRDTSTPRALGAGYERLLTGDALAPAQRDRLAQWMRGNQTSSLRAGLPPRWTSADKTGGGDYGSTNDVGVVYGPDGRRAVLAIMTRSQAADPNAETLRPLIGDVTTLVLPYLSAEG
ncbi:beta-lactamase [Mycobacterium antarcticum]|nr:beta-lactamase [Mycolicibacterium sp. TUM20985]GLP76191.1 beta-lactamase [Mycolicibacterium sp. TUM20983]GLP83429.1 beta-lactamase [Mycolicibacterium sp. TUM20984]